MQGVSVQRGLCAGVSVWRGLCLEGSLSGEVSVQGDLCKGDPPMNRMTDRCKNIALPQTSFVGNNKGVYLPINQTHSYS